MKKSLIAFFIAGILYGAVLLAIGIYMCRLDISKSIAETLVEKASYVGFILVIILYIPIKLIGFACYIFMLFGVGYLLIAARAIYTYCKNNLPELYKIAFGLNITNSCQLALLFMADCIIFPIIFKSIPNGVSVPLIVFTVLINLTAIALETANIFAIKNIKKLSV